MKQDGDAKNGCHKAFCNECCAEINTATIYDFLAESYDDVPLYIIICDYCKILFLSRQRQEQR